MITVIKKQAIENLKKVVTIEELVRRKLLRERPGAYKESREDFPNPSFEKLVKRDGKYLAQFLAWFYTTFNGGSWDFELLELEFDLKTGELLSTADYEEACA